MQALFLQIANEDVTISQKVLAFVKEQLHAKKDDKALQPLFLSEILKLVADPKISLEDTKGLLQFASHFHTVQNDPASAQQLHDTVRRPAPPPTSHTHPHKPPSKTKSNLPDLLKRFTRPSPS